MINTIFSKKVLRLFTRFILAIIGLGSTLAVTGWGIIAFYVPSLILLVYAHIFCVTGVTFIKCRNKRVGSSWQVTVLKLSGTVHLFYILAYRNKIKGCNKLINKMDILMDGTFEFTIKNMLLIFRRSENYEIIDMKQSIVLDSIVKMQL